MRALRLHLPFLRPSQTFVSLLFLRRLLLLPLLVSDHMPSQLFAVPTVVTGTTPSPPPSSSYSSSSPPPPPFPRPSAHPSPVIPLCRRGCFHRDPSAVACLQQGLHVRLITAAACATALVLHGAAAAVAAAASSADLCGACQVCRCVCARVCSYGMIKCTRVLGPLLLFFCQKKVPIGQWRRGGESDRK